MCKYQAIAYFTFGGIATDKQRKLTEKEFAQNVGIEHTMCMYISLAAQTLFNQIVTKLKSKSIYAIRTEWNQTKWKNTLNKLK